MEKAKLLAKNINDFVQYVRNSYRENNKYLSNPDKLFRLKLIVEEYKLSIIADELFRINRFEYDHKYTSLLVHDFKIAIDIIGEYIDLNEHDLFIFSARLYVLRLILNSYEEEIQFQGN
ncbi:hypothetical protein R4Z10_12330 [Niallia sp. XMNu-256]|uniref:hypothetical protein n=1 Tax=Niallia sp. XMNu-256 TaxID=3082444 RepID=UPI0030D2A130